MNRLVLERQALAPRHAAVSRLEKAARLIVPVRADIQDFRIAWIDDDVVDEETRFTEIVEQLPLLASVCGGIDLSVESAEVKAIGIRRIYDERANVTARRAGGAPII